MSKINALSQGGSALSNSTGLSGSGGIANTGIPKGKKNTSQLSGEALKNSKFVTINHGPNSHRASISQ